MIFRTLAKTNLQISCLAIGGNIFGKYCGQKQTRQILAFAQDNGINLIDTANAYNDGLSETFIGAAIKKNRHRWIIASKVGVGRNEDGRGKGARKNILKQIDASLSRLQTGYLDIYQLHRYDEATPLAETFTAFKDLVAQGKIRFFGVSNFSGSQLAEAITLAKTMHLSEFVTAQNHYHLLKRAIEKEIIALCRKHSLSLLVYGALARGILSDKYLTHIPSSSRAATSANIYNDLTPIVIETVRKLDAFCKKQNRSVIQLALLWVLRRPEITSVLVGTRDIKQLSQLIDGLYWKLDQTDLDKIEKLIGNLDIFSSTHLGNYIPV